MNYLKTKFDFIICSSKDYLQKQNKKEKVKITQSINQLRRLKKSKRNKSA
jgi:hypothetical protein